MAIPADRAFGAFFVLFGLALYYFVIPAYVETVDAGWIHPDTIPDAAAITVGCCGAWMMLRPTGHRVPDLATALRAGFYFVLLACGVYLISKVGFLFASPVIALALMLCTGERRPFWLALGVAGMPASIWVFVVLLLERPLP